MRWMSQRTEGRTVTGSIAVITAINYVGVRSGNLANLVLTVAKVGVLVALPLLGIAYMRDDPVLTPVVPPDALRPLASFGIIMIAVMWTYEEWYYVAFASVLFGTLGGAAIFVLRARRPDTPRPYRALGYPVVPALYVLGSFALVWNTLMERPTASIAGLGLVAIGLPFYCAGGAVAAISPVRLPICEPAARLLPAFGPPAGSTDRACHLAF